MKKMAILWFPIAVWIGALNLLSCGGGGGGIPTIDTNFGGGVVTTPIGTIHAEARALAIQPSDAKVVAAGYSNTGTFANPINVFSLARYNTDGSLDTTTFNPTGGTPGIVTTAIRSVNDVDDEAFALAIYPPSQPLAGKLVGAGKSYNSTTGAYEFALARYNTDGSPDTDFGTGGIVTTSIGGIDDEAFALAIDSNGNLVVAGYSINDTTFATEFALARYLPNGTPDGSFGAGGIVTTSIGGIDDEAFALAIQPLDGKLVLAGRSKISTVQNGNIYEFALARYNTDGSLDATGFNATGTTPGIVTTVIGNGGDDEANALVLDSNNNLVAAGYSYNGVQNIFALARYRPNGALDGSFGRQGIVTTAIENGTAPFGINSVAFALAIRPDGKLVAAGYTATNTGNPRVFANVFAVARFNPTGSLDTNFGGAGVATTAIETVNTVDDEAFALVVRSDLSVVAGGRSYNSTTNSYEFALANYLP